MQEDVLSPEMFDQGAVVRELVNRGGLREFIELFWSAAEPRHFIGNWHIDAVCDHLEAVLCGDIKRLVICQPPGTMKPVPTTELVWTRRGYIPLGGVVVGDEVLTHLGRWRHVSAIHEQGQLPILRMQTGSGRVVRAAWDHPFLTPRGWVQAQHLVPGEDTLGLVIEAGDNLLGEITPEQARLCGYLVGDGCLLYGMPSFTNQEPDALIDFEYVVRAQGWSVRRTEKKNNAASSLHIKDVTSGSRRMSDCRQWLQTLGLDRKSSYTKRIPPQILNGSKEVLSHFLGAYWTCDGQEATRSDGPARRGRAWRISCTTVSKGLAEDLLVAFQRLGIRATCRPKSRPLQTRRQGDTYHYFILEVLGKSSLAKLMTLPGLCSRKRREFVADQFDQTLMPDLLTSVEQEPAAACRCLTVEEDHSFTASGFAVKNSLAVGVFWPAYMWTLDPTLSLLFGSFDQTLLNNQSEKMLSIVQSPLYQAAYGDLYQLKAKNPALREFKNSAGGFRFNTTPTGKGTGRHVDGAVVDDPMKPQDAINLSEAAFKEVDAWFDGTLQSRVRKWLLIIMQRLSEKDLAGKCIAEGYDTLILPMRQVKRTMWARDPRTEPGELLWPNNPRYTEEEVENLERKLALQGQASAQLQQDPTPATGGFVEERWCRLEWVEPPITGTFVESWDFSSKGTLESHSKVCGQLWCKTRNLKQAREYISTLDERLAKVQGSAADFRMITLPENGDMFVLVDWVGGHWNYVASKAQFAMAQERPGWNRARIKLIELKANGPAIIEEMKTKFHGIKGVEPEGTKEERYRVHTQLFEAGQVIFPPGGRRDGKKEYLVGADQVREELVKFPRFTWDDNVDCATQALDYLTNSGLAYRENLRKIARGI